MASRGKEEKRDYRLEVADRLIHQIEQGTARWQRPWKPGEILPPVNAVTGKPYRGVNYENLMAFSPDPSDPLWCTYKQAQEKGWQVRQGASGLPLEVWKEYEHKRTVEEIQRLEEQGVTDPDPTERRLGVRYCTVFHASQIDGIPPLERQEPDQKLEDKPDPRLPKLAEGLGVALRYGGGRAFYRPSEDLVQMPPVESFELAVGHDTTLLHEFSHATEHEKRLNRGLSNSFGSEKYVIEELQAEMSAAMTAASLGIGFDPASQDREEGREMGNSAAYLASWLKALPEKERKQILMQAIKDSQGISDYLIERTPEIGRQSPDLARDASMPGLNSMDPDLIEHLEERDRIRQGERTAVPAVGDNWPGGLPTGLGGDRVEGALNFVRVTAMRDPERAKRWAAELRGNPHEYAEKVGLEADHIRGIATQMEEGVKRMERPQVGDLVRFEPNDPDPLKRMPFSGRVIARLDTNTGDHRYHLRAETGPDKEMETRVYGLEGTFRLIDPEQAYGFDRNAPERLAAEKAAEAQVDPKEQAIMAYNRFHQELPENMDRFIERIDQRFDSLDPTSSDAFAGAMRDTIAESDKVFGIVAEGKGRGAFWPELGLARADVEDVRIQELRDIWRDTSEAQTGRYRPSIDAVRERLTGRLKEHGKEVLKNPESLSPKQIVIASYWKHGLLVDDKSQTVDKMVHAIEEKDLKTLLPWIGHNSQNPGSEEAFSRITGVKLGKTQSARVAQLETWAGADRVAALNQEGAEKARQKAEEAPRKALRRAFDALSYSKIQISTEAGFKVIDGQQYIGWKAAHGYTHVRVHKKGAVVERFLQNLETNETSRIKDRRFGAFCKAVHGLEPGGDLMKAMEIAKIPLDLPQKEPEKTQATQVSNPVPKAPDPEKISAYEAKRQARKDRYRALAEKMRLRAKTRLDQAHKMAGAIPFGQPILVGHHSENRDRRYRECIHKTFSQGLGLMDRAEYYERRSERMSNGISSDDPAAVQKLKEKLEYLKMSQEKMKAANAVIRKFRDSDERKSGLERIGFTAEQGDKAISLQFQKALSQKMNSSISACRG